jgi:hypothetical protein
LDVPGADLGLTADEIVGYIQEGRRPAGRYSAAEAGERDSARVYAVQEDLEVAYREMAQDEEREAKALDESEATIGDDVESSPDSQAGR